MLGISTAEYDEMTPRQLRIRASAYAELKRLESEEYGIKFKNEQKLLTMQAYEISRWVWAKKLNINQIMKELDKDYTQKEEMTDEQMLNQIKALNAMFGGAVINDGKE